jgi:hypothetical protein
MESLGFKWPTKIEELSKNRKHYKMCTFVNCTSHLTYHSGQYDCEFDGGCKHFKTRLKVEAKFCVKLCGGTLGTAATTGLLYQPWMIGDDDCEETGVMEVGRGNRSTRRKPAPAPLCPPQILHD